MQNFLEIIAKPDNIAIVVMLVMVVFFTVWAFRQALENDRRAIRGEPVEGEDESRVTVWPHLVRVEMLVAMIVVAGLLLWSILVNAPLEEHANPTLTPNPAKAPWYFLGLQEMLVYFDPWIAGVLLPGLIIVGLMAIPYLDINPRGNGYYTFRERKFAILTFSFGFHILWILLIAIGVFMRGPGWLWYWPWEPWDPSRVAYQANVDLSQLVGVDSSSFAGFLIGGAALALYFGLGMLLPYKYLRRNHGPFLAQLGNTRYLIVSGLFWMMVGLPIKIILRLVLNLKYVWVTPWLSI
jgi:hypothetical protein